ncbi:MAG: hypothetical protein J6U54_03245 [Clostridiales bacterium]|nr:hypothetical protein [Clostridiales bacterium]
MYYGSSQERSWRDNRPSSRYLRRGECKDLLYRRDHIVVDYNPGEENKPALYAHKTISDSIADIEKQIDKINIDRNKYVDKVSEICRRIQEMDRQWLAGKTQNKY